MKIRFTVVRTACRGGTRYSKSLERVRSTLLVSSLTRTSRTGW